MESSGTQKSSAAIFSIATRKGCGFRGLQKTASLNFCAPRRIFRYFPSTDIKRGTYVAREAVPRY
ncbi:hypothetical protein QUF90_00115 [Desulfococcaceae bacterium HSG9]|nr:hypothetical protein [Desulfococcaceae bacterium HSG9]